MDILSVDFVRVVTPTVSAHGLPNNATLVPLLVIGPPASPRPLPTLVTVPPLLVSVRHVSVPFAFPTRIGLRPRRSRRLGDASKYGSISPKRVYSWTKYNARLSRSAQPNVLERS